MAQIPDVWDACPQILTYTQAQSLANLETSWASERMTWEYSQALEDGRWVSRSVCRLMNFLFY